MTPQTQMAALLEELRALAMMHAVITARTDLTFPFEWRCVLAALHDLTMTLLATAETLLRETSAASTPPPALLADVPPGRVH